ncbi:PT domain-containing protein [Providencia sp. PROV152]|nr:PT domain-containing protein [Providencia sp. PROV152]
MTKCVDDVDFISIVINQSTNQPINQSTNQPINQSTNQPINQSTNRLTY